VEPIDTQERRAVMTIALLAAFADGRNEDQERAELRQVGEALGSSLNMAALVQDVLLKRTSLATAIEAVKSPELRRLAYELAVGVCDADGLRNESETRFLADLGQRLGLDQPTIVGAAVDADELATMPLPAADPEVGPVVAAVPAAAAELDKAILQASILNGALELLPQSIATMAIIPLQMKLVYKIGRAHGYEADKSQIKDLLATLGVGLTGQYLEQVGRKLLGGLFGKVAGGLAGSLASGATGVTFSFATTYAIGQVARRYYAGGRVMSAELIQRTFSEMLAQGKTLQAEYLPQIQQRARTLDVAKIVQTVRGN
jgi:uncharacterized protein (DUF697 family)/tellurite resistance protein